MEIILTVIGVGLFCLFLIGMCKVRYDYVQKDRAEFQRRHEDNGV